MFARLALGLALCAAIGCTAVYDDFEQCSVEPPRTFETPPCGPDYLVCLDGCGGNEECRDRCTTERPECAACFTDTFRNCAEENFGCEAAYVDLICCVEGLCPITDPLCADCAGLNDVVNDCWAAAGPVCQPRLNDCVEGL